MAGPCAKAFAPRLARLARIAWPTLALGYGMVAGGLAACGAHAHRPALPPPEYEEPLGDVEGAEAGAPGSGSAAASAPGPAPAPAPARPSAPPPTRDTGAGHDGPPPGSPRP